MNTFIDSFNIFLPEINYSITGALALLVLVLVVFVVVLFLYRNYLIRRSKNKEYWLPVVDDGGRVIGRVARSVSLETPGVYQHPLIRMMVLKAGSIYLSPRTYEFCPDIGRDDHPFECMMEYGFSVEETLETLQNKFFPNSAPPQFLLRYKHENEIGCWQVLLYVLTIQDENELIGLNRSFGKFWTQQQIRENQGKSYFSSFLEGEIHFFEALLKN